MNYLALVSVLAVSLPSYGAGHSMDLTIDSAKSEITWVGKKVTGQHTGTIQIKSGTVTFEGDVLTKANVVVDMNSINDKDLTNPEYKAKLESHLKSEDFFDVAKNPEATFELTRATPGKTKGSYQFAGNLTVRGITNPITLDGTVKKAGDHYELTSKFKFDRSKFNVKYNSGKFFDVAKLGDKLVYDDIELALNVKTTVVQTIDAKPAAKKPAKK